MGIEKVYRKLRVNGDIDIKSGYNIVHGATTISETDFAKIDGITNGTAAANKAAVLGANKNLDEFHTAALYLGAGAGTAVTATAAEVNKLASIGGTPVVAKRGNFAETAGAGTYTWTCTLPANAVLLDIIVHATSLWTATTSATLTVGDDNDPDGFYTGVDMKATDLLAGESLSFDAAGGKAGAYIANSQVSKRRDPSDRTITAAVVTVGAAGNGGATSVTVVYSLPVSADITSATKA